MITSLFWQVFGWAVGLDNYMFVTVQLSKTRTSSQTSLENTERFSWILSCDVALIRYVTITEVCKQAKEDTHLIISDHQWLWFMITLDNISHTLRDSLPNHCRVYLSIYPYGFFPYVHTGMTEILKNRMDTWMTENLEQLQSIRNH